MLTLPRVRVQVTRDLASPVAEVFLHEVPILRAAHGEADVKVIETLPHREIESVNDEWDRMHAVYRRLNDNPVMGGYPGGVTQFADAVTQHAEQLMQQAASEPPRGGSRKVA